MPVPGGAASVGGRSAGERVRTGDDPSTPVSYGHQYRGQSLACSCSCLGFHSVFFLGFCCCAVTCAFRLAFSSHLVSKLLFLVLSLLPAVRAFISFAERVQRFYCSLAVVEFCLGRGPEAYCCACCEAQRCVYTCPTYRIYKAIRNGVDKLSRSFFFKKN